jgi:hypothetical protein
LALLVLLPGFECVRFGHVAKGSAPGIAQVERCLLPAQSTANQARESIVSRLAKFFPAASPLRLPVQLKRDSGVQPGQENTVVEFGTTREIFFASALPLEFAEKLRVQNSDRSLDVEVQVVAVQYHDGQLAVAARFIGDVSNWIIKA